MTDYIIKKYLKENGKGRKKAGILLSIYGVIINLLLFILKYSSGVLSGSIAITADGFNNLTDVGACVLSLIGFHLGSRKSSKKYPLGYGRLEYISGFLISVMVLFIGADMLISSADKIAHPDDVSGGGTVIVILILSVIIKAYMYAVNNRLGRMIESSGIRATAIDSLCDCIATVAILFSVILEDLTGFNADGYTGILVAFCILYAGFSSISESLSPLLKNGMSAEALDTLSDIVAEYRGIYSLKDIAIHDCGPERKLLTFYISCSEPCDVIPKLRRSIKEKMDMEAFISVYDEKEEHKNNSLKSGQKYS